MTRLSPKELNHSIVADLNNHNNSNAEKSRLTD